MSLHSDGSVLDVVSNTFPAKSIIVALLFTSGLVSSLGCRNMSCGTSWREPHYAAPDVRKRGARVSSVERLYAKARSLEADGKCGCVDAYFQVAAATCVPSRAGHSRNHRTIELHRSALAKLVVTGQLYGRLDPASGLTLNRGSGSTFVPIAKTGFVWQSFDFQHLVPVGTYRTNQLSKAYCSGGIGVPLVVLRDASVDEQFMRKISAFSATLVMRNATGSRESGCLPRQTIALESEGVMVPQQPTLELLNSRRLRHVQMGGQTKRLARDLSAPLVYRLSTDPRNYWQEFLRPDSGLSEGQLQMLEPYQPGKIPVVFIHGLLSDPYTWSQMVNELLARPGFVERFQIWVYNYPSGKAFISSATKLRSDLAMLRQCLDPERKDPALSETVLVGHSLGGLLAKLQVTASHDELWKSVANQSLDELNVPEQFREELRQYFYFDPSPDVKRVVFMGTPHRGSAYAKRCVGRLTSKLVRRPLRERTRHQRMIACNPGVFSKEVRDRIPTSIDLLDPDSQLLQAINTLQVGPDVRLHSIIGDYCWRIGFGRSDLVVPVESAKESSAVSELVIKAKHKNVNKDLVVVRELLCILQKHAANDSEVLLDASDVQEDRVNNQEPSDSGSTVLDPHATSITNAAELMHELAHRTRMNADKFDREKKVATLQPLPLTDRPVIDFSPMTSLQSVVRPKSVNQQASGKVQPSGSHSLAEQDDLNLAGESASHVSEADLGRDLP